MGAIPQIQRPVGLNMDDQEVFVLGFTGEEVKSLITTTTTDFVFSSAMLDHVIGSEAWRDEVGTWSRTNSMAAALIVYKAYQLSNGVSAIVKHMEQIWVWIAPTHRVDGGYFDEYDTDDGKLMTV